jgi:membrane-bound metal-dependent hydrolase YbcI (DUF457 family)
VPSSIAHASVAILASPIVPPEWRSASVIGLTAIAAAAPDIDAIGRPFGHGDLALFGGHRAVTHSIFTAVLLGVVALLVVPSHASHADRLRIAVFVAAVVAAHGVLDAFTIYGEGVAFFAPLSMHRWKSAWQPFGGLWSEVLTLWIPALLMYRLWLQRFVVRQ